MRACVAVGAALAAGGAFASPSTGTGDVLTVRNAAELYAALTGATPGQSIHALGGIYELDRPLVVPDGVALAGDGEMRVDATGTPQGWGSVVTTLRDPEGRRTVRNLLARDLPRVFPVGRLDVQSTGLLLLTNDGELAARLMHPRRHVPRTYRVKVRGQLDERALARLRRGVRLDDGPTGPADVAVEKELPTKSWLRLTVHEGRRHLVRRMCHAVGHGAEKLQRVALGPLELGRLPLGAARELTRAEVRALRRAVELGDPPGATRVRRRRPRDAPRTSQ